MFLIINDLLCNCRKTSWFGNIYKFDKSLSFLGTCSEEKKTVKNSYDGNSNMKRKKRRINNILVMHAQ